MGSERKSNSKSSNSKSSNSSSDYTLLKKKIQKIGSILGKLKVKGQIGTKEYRAYQRKEEKYYQQLYKTREYKEKKLKSALDNLHTEVLSSCGSSGSSSSSSDDDSSSSSSSSSGSSSSEKEEKEKEPKVDRELIQKKYDKVTQLLLQLEKKHGKEIASDRKEYKTYLNKHQKYFEILAKGHPEWVQQEQIVKARRKAEAEAARLEREQRQLVEQAKAAERAKLEAQKQAIRDKIRKEQAQRMETERLKEQAYEVAKKAEDNLARKQMQKLDEEAAKRGKEFDTMLHVQEDLGIIRLGKNASA